MKKTVIYISLTIVAAMFALPGRAIDRKSLVEYAASLKGKKAELKEAIYRISKPKKVLSYGTGSSSTWAGFYKTDRIGNTLECVNRYSTKRFYFSSTNTSTAITGMNIEHSFPKSWWGRTTNQAYKDLFNLYPSDSGANSEKSNYPMCRVDKVKNNGYEKIGTTEVMINGRMTNITCFEPNDTWKGDFSRSYFYMATTYQDLTWQGTQGLQQLEKDTWPTLREWAYKLYLEWTRNDKVLDVEVNRNNTVYGIQGNRNLYIDFPFLAEYVWGDSIDVAFNPETSMTTAVDDDRYGNYEYSGGNTDEPEVPGEGGDTDEPGAGGNESELNADIAMVVFAETFDNCVGNGGNDNTWSGSTTNVELKDNTDKADMAGWTMVKVFEAYNCIKAGSGSSLGSATTPVFTVSKGVPVELTFKAGAWNGSSESTTLKLKFTGFDVETTTVTLEKGKWNTYSITLIPTATSAQITWEGEKASNSRFFLDEIQVKEYPKVDISAVGYSTYYNSKYAYIMPEGVEGYVAYYDGGEWKLECAYNEDDVVPAGEALVLKGDEGAYILYAGSSDGETWTSVGMNALRGTDEKTALEADYGAYFYALTLNSKNDANSIGFYWMNKDGAAFTNGAHKAYLKVEKSQFDSGAKMGGFAFGEAVTGIESVSIVPESQAYNLLGMPVAPDAKGFVIRNGRKYFNR